MPDDTPTQRQEDDTEFDSELPTVVAPKVALVFYDDPETPADFVLHLLERFCGQDEARAREIVRRLADKGQAVAGEFNQAVGRIKLGQVQEAARGKYPFRATLEPLD